MSQTQELPLVGYIEIAMRAGVQRTVVTVWRSRYEDFPKPVATLEIGPIWWWPDVKEWLIKTYRRYDVNADKDTVVPPERKERLKKSGEKD